MDLESRKRILDVRDRMHQGYTPCLFTAILKGPFETSPGRDSAVVVHGEPDSQETTDEGTLPLPDEEQQAHAPTLPYSVPLSEEGSSSFNHELYFDDQELSQDEVKNDQDR